MFSNAEYYHLKNQINSFMWGVYGWMSCAIALTAYSAYFVAHTPMLFKAVHSAGILVFAFQIGIVLALSFLLDRMSFYTALALFMVYAISLGVTLSVIFHIYTTGSIITTFVSTAGMFGVMAIYGYFTKTDLTSIGNIAIMMLVGLILSSLINLFMRSSAFDLILSAAGVVIFTLLTAYDSQKIKMIGAQLIADQEEIAKVTIMCALTLYLDFINLFLYLLRFLGKQRD